MPASGYGSLSVDVIFFIREEGGSHSLSLALVLVLMVWKVGTRSEGGGLLLVLFPLGQNNCCGV